MGSDAKPVDIHYGAAGAAGRQPRLKAKIAKSVAVAELDASRPSGSLAGSLQRSSFANTCHLDGQARRADLVWSRGEFLAICEHMLNDNPLSHFLTAWVDPRTGTPRFAKAPYRKRADDHAAWAWDTVTGKAKAQTSLGFYPSSQNQMTRWGAIDFDAHDGEHDRARNWSLRLITFYSSIRTYTSSCAHQGAAGSIFLSSLETCVRSATGLFC